MQVSNLSHFTVDLPRWIALGHTISGELSVADIDEHLPRWADTAYELNDPDTLEDKNFVITEPIVFTMQGERLLRNETIDKAHALAKVDARNAPYVVAETGSIGHLHVKAETAVTLQCGRCLKPLRVTLQLGRTLAVYANAEAADASLAGFADENDIDANEPLSDESNDEATDPIVASPHFDLLAQLEEELLLALPYAPVHENPACSAPAALATRKPTAFDALKAHKFG